MIMTHWPPPGKTKQTSRFCGGSFGNEWLQILHLVTTGFFFYDTTLLL